MMNRGIRERWQPPPMGMVKCNNHANWRNAHLHCGDAWIIRDHTGMVRHHARDDFMGSSKKILAELRCILWALCSVQDLQYTEIVIGSDCQVAMEALAKLWIWPRYGAILTQINEIQSAFASCVFEEEFPEANSIAREIAKSILRDDRFQSYLALGGPSWLQDRIARETAL